MTFVGLVCIQHLLQGLNFYSGTDQHGMAFLMLLCVWGLLSLFSYDLPLDAEFKNGVMCFKLDTQLELECGKLDPVK